MTDHAGQPYAPVAQDRRVDDRWVGERGEQGTDRRDWPDRLCLSRGLSRGLSQGLSPHAVLAFDPIRLAADLARIEANAWIPHFVPQHYEGDWSVLPLRAPVGATHPILRIAPNPQCRDWEDTDLLGACPYIRQVLAAFACPLEAVRLMQLAPGSVIKEHRDHDLAAENGMARLHIPITTNPAVDFRLNGTQVRMMPATTWYLRLADPHSVTNGGTTPRVHLVIDALVDPWLEDRLDAAATATAATAAMAAGVVQA